MAKSMSTPTTRQIAYAQGAKTYNTGKPCRNGHFADRYTSGGNCLTCIGEATQRQTVTNAQRRRVHNAQVTKDSFFVTLSIPPPWHPIFEQLQVAALRATDEQRDRMAAIVAALHDENKHPFVAPALPLRPTIAISRAELAKHVEYRNGKVLNMADLNIIDNRDDQYWPTLLVIGVTEYVGEDVMKCLAGEISSVMPFDRKKYIAEESAKGTS